MIVRVWHLFGFWGYSNPYLQGNEVSLVFAFWKALLPCCFILLYWILPSGEHRKQGLMGKICEHMFMWRWHLSGAVIRDCLHLGFSQSHWQDYGEIRDQNARLKTIHVLFICCHSLLQRLLTEKQSAQTNTRSNWLLMCKTGSSGIVMHWHEVHRCQVTVSFFCCCAVLFMFFCITRLWFAKIFEPCAQLSASGKTDSTKTHSLLLFWVSHVWVS